MMSMLADHFPWLAISASSGQVPCSDAVAPVQTILQQSQKSDQGPKGRGQQAQRVDQGLKGRGQQSQRADQGLQAQLQRACKVY